jgi:hypothetical protein
VISAALASVGGFRYFAQAEIVHLPPLSRLLDIGNMLRLVKNWALGMKLTLLGVAAFAVQVAPAWATMPLLDEKPPMRTDEACWAWADQQAKDEEVASMWGVLDDGNSDRAIAVRRLGDDCLGKPKPDIVGFGSSAGFDRDYCRHHPRQKI